MNKKAKLVLTITITALSCAGLLILEGQTKFLRRTYDDLILGNKYHYLSCEELPPEQEVIQTMAEHEVELERIRQVSPGFVDVEIDSQTCPGKADLLIWFGTQRDGELIGEIIGGERFHGIPYRLQNR